MCRTFSCMATTELAAVVDTIFAVGMWCMLRHCLVAMRSMEGMFLPVKESFDRVIHGTGIESGVREEATRQSLEWKGTCTLLPNEPLSWGDLVHCRKWPTSLAVCPKSYQRWIYAEGIYNKQASKWLLASHESWSIQCIFLLSCKLLVMHPQLQMAAVWMQECSNNILKYLSHLTGESLVC